MAFCIEQPGLFADRSGWIAGGLAGRCRKTCIMQVHAGQNAGFLAGRARAQGLAAQILNFPAPNRPKTS